MRTFVPLKIRTSARALLLTAALGVGCGDKQDNTVVSEPNGSDGSAGSGGGSGAEQTEDCFENPTSHLELINACTKAVRIKRTPDLSLLNADGSLPPP
ncbi:MAG: hypothetical protein RL685_1280 [Pseudomonadota bacterium]|jgi:uncharacterized sporulation protein YeaH/YhbH (DUF444 family)